MQDLRETPFSLVRDDPIIVVAQARNIKGWGEESNENLESVLVTTEPGAV